MSKKLISWLLFISLCLIWGSSFKLMKDSTATLTGSQIASLRIFMAALICLPFLFLQLKKIEANRLPLVALSAVIGNLLPAFLFAIALTRIDGSLGGILNALTPICVVLIGLLFYGDRIAAQKMIGLFIGFIGLVLLTLMPVLTGQRVISFDNMSYLLLPVVGTLLYGVNVNMVSHRLKDINPINLAMVSLGFMIIPASLLLWQLDFFSLDFTNPAIQEAIIATSALGVLGSTVATILFYSLVQLSGGLFASLVTYGIPFVALFWGFLDNEAITILKIGCLLLILIGVYLANHSPSRK
ncbi:MAG: DMT family transporter [Bacteroidetes bacterium]|nr:DMT family transporter [Bacteroidota bacterium]